MKRMNDILRLSTLIAVLFLGIQNLAVAQVSYMLDEAESSAFVRGTSTIHDWEMKVEQLQGSITLAEAGSINSLQKGNFQTNVESLKSDRNLMNKKTYEALKSKKHPQITVQVNSVKEVQGKLVANLVVTIAGQTQKVTDEIELKTLANQSLSVQGILDLKMTSYQVEPPVALMGTIKTDDEVKVAYHLIFKQK
ncbi:YceI family protein [Sunxiuqinia elliptica]|uniref:YceI-like domain-containing protein n=2 Tax=Sunxiuqinia elliptica TaxID=655355 RepID=A0A4R6GPM5_9BACT|nr:YceI family protein [Sunxiuqinia elliptica]TDN97241.1 YceI-like domain-containing protein [Sunxiuqinia elliptica]TDO60575.1 YceI-like domain-containing protein [Sunxiuqinia elliptica]